METFTKQSFSCLLCLCCAVVSPVAAAADPVAGPEHTSAPANPSPEALLDDISISPFPMDPAEISEGIKQVEEQEETLRDKVFPPPQAARRRQVFYELSSDDPTPVIQIPQRYLVSVVFSDYTGQPWPISSISVGDSAFLQADLGPAPPGNSLTLAIKAATGSTNAAITLHGDLHPLRLVVTAERTPPEVFYDLVEVLVGAPGPRARVPVVGPPALADFSSTDLHRVLRGQSPVGGRLFHEEDGLIQVWTHPADPPGSPRAWIRLMGNDFTLVLPAPERQLFSAESQVYVIPFSSLITVNKGGVFKDIKLPPWTLPASSDLTSANH